MPLKSAHHRSKRSSSSHVAAAVAGPRISRNQGHQAFIPLVVVCLILWVIYRALFKFPVAFDEVIGKALFFGLPVWLYVSATRSLSIPETLQPSRLKSGLLLGIAYGGLFGFAAAIVSSLRPSTEVQTAAVFSSPLFWGEFFLALVTGFWETLFFFGWIYTIMAEKWAHWSTVKTAVCSAAVFLVFHLPNILLRFSGTAVIAQICLLFLFAIGQGLIFSRRRNAYTLVISHAIWGMVLLLHF